MPNAIRTLIKRLKLGFFVTKFLEFERIVANNQILRCVLDPNILLSIK